MDASIALDVAAATVVVQPDAFEAVQDGARKHGDD